MKERMRFESTGWNEIGVPSTVPKAEAKAVL